MHSQTVTVWNFHAASNMWYPTVLPGVSTWTKNASEASSHGGNSDDSFSASIFCSRSDSDILILTADGVRKKVLSPKAYAQSQVPDEHLTFAPGVDFIVEGVADGQSPVSDEDYESGFYDAMNNANDGVHLITSAIYYSLIPHYEIEGK